MNNKEIREMKLKSESIMRDSKEKYKEYKVNKNEKEPKTAIWWMIMLFCIVYGFEQVYKTILLNGGL